MALAGKSINRLVRIAVKNLDREIRGTIPAHLIIVT